MGFETDTFIEISLVLPERHKVEFGAARLDVIIREGGILDSQIENLRKRRYGPGRAKHLEEVLFPRLEAKCLDILKRVPPESRPSREVEVREAFNRARVRINMLRYMELYRYLDSKTPEMLEALRDLVRFETVAPPGKNYHQIVDHLIPIFEDLGFETEKVVMPQEIFDQRCGVAGLVGDRVNLRARLDAGAEETLVIYTHLDVVPAGDGWSSDPFDLDIREGRVYGRGVADSKGAVAALVSALGAVRACGRHQYNLEILLTTDEEVGGYSGLCYFTDAGLVQGDQMLCMDSFSDDVIIGCNGIITWQATVRGRSVHSGASFLGENAIEKAIPVIEALLELKKRVEARRSTLRASSELQPFGLDQVRPMLNVTVIHGGVKENIVPDRCVVRGDRRVIAEERMEEAASEMERAVAALPVDLEWRAWMGYPPMRIDPDHPWVAEVSRALEKASGKRPRLAGAQYSLDQAYVVEVTGIPSCVYGVGRQTDSNPHGPDENVTLEDLSIYARFLASLMTA
ncbi:M20 family metallopeptidase [Methanocrinis sp.]|uniref:M20 family metallopeptidase n=1 Tax=Methanocrinis sp. TaxID=3101522 RepID=UPI003D0E5E15